MSYRSPVGEIRRIGAVVVLVGLLATAPAAAQIDARLVGPDTYLTMFDEADLRGVVQPDAEVYDRLVAITGDAALDQRIRVLAEIRGYIRRPLSSVGLVPVDGRLLQAPAAEAWTAMKAAARADGISLVLTSAHRDLDAQGAIFRARLGGRTTDAAIELTLRTSAPPGYSKHHGGYAIDVGQAGTGEAGFAATAAYRWLAELDFARAKRFGFIPSYPLDGERMGPGPEAWEFVWVGPGRIACATGAEPLAGFCDIATDARVDDIVWLADLGVTVGCAPQRFCPDDPVTRGEAASMLWRLHGAPAPVAAAPFVDVYPADHFRPAVDWLWSLGVVGGTSATTFSPDAFLDPVDALVLAVRLAAADDRPPAAGILGTLPDEGTVPPDPGAPGSQVSRAEFASTLRAVVAA